MPQAQRAPQLRSLTYDLLRLISTFHHAVQESPTQIYYAATYFSPDRSALSRFYSLQSIPKYFVSTQNLTEWSACLLTLEGHSTAVNDLVFSPDGTTVASVSFSGGVGGVRLWDTKTGECQHTLYGDVGNIDDGELNYSLDGSAVIFSSNKVICTWNAKTGERQCTLEKLPKESAVEYKGVFFSLDGSILTAIVNKNNVDICNVQTGKLEYTLEGHTDVVSRVRFSANQSNFLTVSWDRTLRIWDAATGDCRHTLKGHRHPIRDAAFSNDGLMVASWDDEHARIWEAQTGQQILERQNEPFRRFVFLPDGQSVASKVREGSVHIWNFKAAGGQHTFEDVRSRPLHSTFSPDGSLLAFSLVNKTVEIFDVKTGKRKQTLKGHSDLVRQACFSPDGLHLASASCDTTLNIWSVDAKEPQESLQGHLDAISEIAISPDESLVASASLDETIRTWNIKTGECQRTFKGHPSSNSCEAFSSDGLIGDANSISCIAFSLDSSEIASGSMGGEIRVWNVGTGECKQTLQNRFPGEEILVAIAFSSDGSTILIGLHDGLVNIWDVKTGEHQYTMHAHLACIDEFTSFLDSSVVASGRAEYPDCMWDLTTSTSKQVMKGPTEPIGTIKLSPDGLRVVTISGNTYRRFRIWNSMTGKCNFTSGYHTDRIRIVEFSEDGSTLAVVSGDQISLHDSKSGRCKNTLKSQHDYPVFAICLSVDASLIAQADIRNLIRIWDVEKGDFQYALEGHSDFIADIAFSPDGSTLASASDDTTIRTWDTKTGKCVHVLEGHLSRVHCIKFVPDGSTLASGSEDQTVRIWDTAEGNCRYILRGHSNSVWSIDVSRDGSLLATGSEDKTSRIWDLKTGRGRYGLVGHSGRISKVMFSSDGTKLHSICRRDNTIRIWSVATGKCLQIIEGNLKLNIAEVAISPDTSAIFVTGCQRVVRLWDTKTSKYLHTLHIGSEPRHDVQILPCEGAAATSNPNPRKVKKTNSRYRKDRWLEDWANQASNVQHLVSEGLPIQHTATPATLSEVDVQDGWLVRGSQRLLWLPSEYRPGVLECSSDTIIIGSPVGRVTFIRLPQ